jgi:hypothetical protein
LALYRNTSANTPAIGFPVCNIGMSARFSRAIALLAGLGIGD